MVGCDQYITVRNVLAQRPVPRLSRIGLDGTRSLDLDLFDQASHVHPFGNGSCLFGAPSTTVVEVVIDMDCGDSSPGLALAQKMQKAGGIRSTAKRNNNAT